MSETLKDRFYKQVGCEESENVSVQLALSLSRKRDAFGLLRSIAGYNDAFSVQHAKVKAPTSIAALATCMQENSTDGEMMSPEQRKRWMSLWVVR